MLTVQAEKRDAATAVATIRAAGKMPAVFYGPKTASTPVSVSKIEFKKAFKVAGESSVITLKDGAEEHDALIYDVDFDPVTNEPRHADFYIIEKGQKVTVNVPLHFEGVSPAVKELGGVLVKVLHDLEIEAAPKDLPHAITIDLGALAAIDSQILAKNIQLPRGVELVTDADEVVALISEAKEEAEETAAVDLSAIEVEQKGKKEEEGEAAAE